MMVLPLGRTYIDYGRYWLTIAEGIQPDDVPTDRRDLVAGPRKGHSLDEIERMLEGKHDA
jgi:hypothetical protein